MSFRCLSDEMLAPKSRPLLCLSSQAKRDVYNVACCSNEDGCNANLSVPLTLKQDVKPEPPGNDDATVMNSVTRFDRLNLQYFAILPNANSVTSQCVQFGQFIGRIILSIFAIYATTICVTISCQNFAKC